MEQKPKLHDWCFIVLFYLWSAVSSQSRTTGSVTTVLNLVRLSYNLSNIVSFFKINVTIIEWSYILKGKSISLSFSHVTCNTYIQHILYNTNYWSTRASQVVLFGVKKKKPACNAGDMRDSSSISRSGRSPGEDMATHSQYFSCRIPWTEEPSRLQSMGSLRVGCSWNLVCMDACIGQSCYWSRETWFSSSWTSQASGASAYTNEQK